MSIGFASDEQLEKLDASPLLVGANSLLNEQRAFLNAYMVRGTVRGAEKASKIHHIYHYNWLKDDPVYQAAFARADAIVLDDDIADIRQRGVKGWLEPLSYQGMPTGFKIRRYSDNLAMFYIKRKDPAFRDNHKVEIEHSGEVTVKHQFNHSQYAELYKSTQVIELQSTESNDSIPQVDQSTTDLIKLGDGK